VRSLFQVQGYRAEEIIRQHFSFFYPPEKVKAGYPDRELETAAAKGRLRTKVGSCGKTGQDLG